MASGLFGAPLASGLFGAGVRRRGERLAGEGQPGRRGARSGGRRSTPVAVSASRLVRTRARIPNGQLGKRESLLARVRTNPPRALRVRRVCCGIGGYGNSALRGVAWIGVMAIPSERQQGVLLDMLRFWGLWQPDSCHNPRSDNGQAGETAITPNYATRDRRRRYEPDDKPRQYGRTIRTGGKTRRGGVEPELESEDIAIARLSGGT